MRGPPSPSRGDLAKAERHVSWATTPAARRSMQSNRSTGTRPEMAIRRELHRRGLRYRVAARPIPEFRRTVDVLFSRARVAVEIRGCFWHGCPEHARLPTAHREYWEAKVARNRARDDETERRLAEAGWTLVVVWEHDPVSQAAGLIEALVRQRRSG